MLLTLNPNKEMFFKCLLITYIYISVTQSQIVAILSVVVIFFFILLIFGIRKFYLLKKENELVNNSNYLQNTKDNKTYDDFK